jgi:hypothetical protein
MILLPGRCTRYRKKTGASPILPRSGSHKAASSTQQFPCVPDPLLRPSVLSPVDDPLLIFGGHRHAIIRRIRCGFSLLPAFCQFFGIYLVINHDALLLWKNWFAKRQLASPPIAGRRATS